MFHDQEKSGWCFNDLIQVNDVRMSHNFQNVNLPSHSLNIVCVINLVFLENLDSDFLTSEYMVALFDLAKGTLT